MSRRYPAIAFGESVKEVQREQGSRAMGERLESMEWDDQAMGEREEAHIQGLDHFFMATSTESGWPYLQFRGGPPGFLRVLDSRALGFADYRGNTQYISSGNVRHDDRVALFLMDYPNRRRLKIFARAEIRDGDSDLLGRLVDESYSAVVERAYLFHVEAFDWNCPQHITPRFTVDELRSLDPGTLAAILAADPSNDQEA